MRLTSRAKRPDPGGQTTAPPGPVTVRFVSSDSTWNVSQSSARPVNPWSAWSAWPNHPAILPPLPRVAKSEALAAPILAPAPRVSVPTSPAKRANAPMTPQTAKRAMQHTSHYAAPAPSRIAPPAPRRVSTQPQRQAQAAPVRSMPPKTVERLEWPETFDDWMIDIVRRRALRLNSGARRRGVRGAVRAVELAQILERSADANGRWRCAICHDTVTLADLSFDHVLALADGGEHAAHNLVPAHRKCNEIKGSEKAQYRAQALDRWLSEWSTGRRESPRYPTPERRYA